MERVSRLVGQWRLPVGGMQAYADALTRVARREGVEVATGARVERIVVRGGRAAGVWVTGHGQVVARRAIASSAGLAQTLVGFLRGAELLVPRERAPALGDDEWWAEELEGCAVHDGELEVGVVRRLLALPSCEVLEVERAGAGDLLVPLVADAVRAVDVAARRIDVNLAFLGET